MELRTALPTALSLGALLGAGIVCLSFAPGAAKEQQAVRQREGQLLGQ